MATSVGTVTFTGTVVTDQLTTGPWVLYGVQFPDYGAVPFMPLFEVDVLQPVNVDGARYRLGGAHFPTFRMLTVCAARDYSQASRIAREHEMTMGDFVSVDINNDYNTPRTCAVVRCRSVPNARRIIGATASDGTSVSAEALASVDTEWTLQVIAE